MDGTGQILNSLSDINRNIGVLLAKVDGLYRQQEASDQAQQRLSVELQKIKDDLTSHLREEAATAESFSRMNRVIEEQLLPAVEDWRQTKSAGRWMLVGLTTAGGVGGAGIITFLKSLIGGQ